MIAFGANWDGHHTFIFWWSYTYLYTRFIYLANCHCLLLLLCIQPCVIVGSIPSDSPINDTLSQPLVVSSKNILGNQ